MSEKGKKTREKKGKTVKSKKGEKGKAKRWMEREKKTRTSRTKIQSPAYLPPSLFSLRRLFLIRHRP